MSDIVWVAIIGSLGTLGAAGLALAGVWVNVRAQKALIVTATEQTILDLRAENETLRDELDVWKRLALTHMPHPNPLEVPE